MAFFENSIPFPGAREVVMIIQSKWGWKLFGLAVRCGTEQAHLVILDGTLASLLFFVPAHTPKPILRNLLFWLSKVASSIHSTRGSVRPGSLRLTTLAPFKWIKKSSLALAFGKRVGVNAVFAVAVRAEQAVVSVTGQGLVTSRHTTIPLLLSN
ncbi:hypothetical protein Fot_04900 [Forsythia ovata]|uniref:Uncharacterized protein n=1 Tax=Forsythia ovata TaxID=205694 RepID=A0ABD1WNL1_9LAMI